MSAALPWIISFSCTAILWALVMRLPFRQPTGAAVVSASLLLWTLAAHGINQEAAFLAAGLTLVLIASAVAVDPAATRGIERGLLVAGCGNAIAGLSQYFGIAPLLAPWVFAGGLGEAFGNVRQPNQYASLCWLSVAVLVFGRWPLSSFVSRCMAALLGIAAAASASRTGLIEGLLLITLAGMWPGAERRGRVILCSFAVGAYFSAAVLLPLVLEAITGELPARALWKRFDSGASCSSRAVLWSNVLHLIGERPLRGWGPGELDYAHFVTLYPGDRFCEILDNAHSLPLHVAVELGVPAAVLTGGLAIWWVARQRPWAEQEPQRQCAWALLAIVTLHSMLEYPLWYGPFQVIFGVSLGWLMADRLPQRVMRVSRYSVAAATFLLAAVLYIAWDYVRISQAYLPPAERVGRWREDPLSHARSSWLFSNQVTFAELTVAPLTRANADWMYAASQRMLHYSPEPRVIERLVESAVLAGHESEALPHLARFRAAFPREYDAWRKGQEPAIQD